MTDPLTALGGAASVVQLVDVALRFSREAYGFLCAVRDAPEDVKELRHTLHDTESYVRSLRDYINESSGSTSTTDEFGALSEPITRAIKGLCNDIFQLQTILPPNFSTNPASRITWTQRAKWVFDKKRVKEIKTTLDSRKD
ncbi:hypothetical protein AOQ84DRAFT_278910 [Glonium stellatum]|uniref:Fungal N-terminal domain-containing protein n=1 Tax=Glonium stellatum TaxID=574774 RepID=A0A8E2FGT5_9PEZI|nr:hypothetical protein AOQ84DRAFT_278910 [Glonium stellatum]